MNASKGNLRRIGLNTFSVLGGDVLNKGGVFFVYALIARSDGVREFGQLSLGLLLLYTFHVFAVAGLPISLTREVAKHPRNAKRLLRHGYVAAILPSILSMLAMVSLAFALKYERDTVTVIAILSLAIPFYVYTMITEAVIKGRQQMHLIPIGNLPGNVFLILGSMVVLMSGYGVAAVAMVVVTSRIITLLLMYWLLRNSTRDRRAGRLHLRFSWLLLTRSMVFLGSDGVQAIGASMFALLLSKFASEADVGLLSASFQLLQPIQMFYRSVGHSVFPQLVAAARTNSKAVSELGRSILGLILKLAFPAMVVVFHLAGDLLVTVYGNETFHRGAIALQILAMTLMLDPMNPILGHAMWAVGRDKIVLRIVVVNMVTNLVVGFVLISQFGLVGAATSALLASLVNMIQHLWFFNREVGSLYLVNELTSIAPAALACIVCLTLLPVHPYLGLLLALLVYVAIVFPGIDGFSAKSQVT